MTEHALVMKMATIRGEVLLSSEFGLYPKKRNVYKVSLSRTGLFYSLQTDKEGASEIQVVHLSDVIGCRCQRSVGCASAFITIFSYPFKQKVFSSKSTRKRVLVIFEVKIFSSFDDNLKLAEKWRNVINCLSRSLPLNVEDLDSCCPPPPGRLLILINPHSGPGKGLQIFENEVKPMLEEAEIPYKMKVTEYAGHARDLLQTLALSEWYAVVIVSGDGLIYEAINGLMERPDWEKAIQIPMGCIPGGSGNALCCSINYSAGEPVIMNAVLHSTFILIKHKVVPMDLVLIQTPSQRIFSFLSVTWGIMADIDFESEKYRSIGEARFTLGAIKRILNLRSYKGKVSFLPIAEYSPKGVNGETKNAVLTKIRRFSLRSCSNSKSTLSSGSIDRLSAFGSQDLVSSDQNPSSSQLSPSNSNGSIGEVNGNMADQVLNLQESQEHSILTNSANRCSMDSSGDFSSDNNKGCGDAAQTLEPVNSTTNGHFAHGASGDTNQGLGNNVKLERSTLTASGSHGDIEIETETVSAKKSENHGMSYALLPPLDQPVPDNWVVIEDGFILVSALYQTHLGSKMLAAPQAHLSDGFMYLMFIRDGIPRNTLLSLFLSFGEGGHVDSPYVEIVKVLAFRLEPSSTNGNIMIDGERIDVTPLQCQVLPQISRIMAIQ
ncbi:LOW QUALITY PROTEIN: sphingosine kinase 1-like [Haliotis rubra]|uniref:LOW QUALITY PROTEIN: sphingosine kinase 1-like n=1 Tax=Haliotis rubra TaxID=36100 RepID=UPI001EE5F5CE|nr:LOW QUALITY PROTEIN: sphingosine kinase 1-like [Haliotis rubra]